MKVLLSEIIGTLRGSLGKRESEVAEVIRRRRKILHSRIFLF